MPTSLRSSLSDGRLAAALPEKGELRLWEVASEKPLPLHDKNIPVYVVAFSPDSQLLALAAGSNLSVWEVVSGRKVCAGHDPAGVFTTSLSFSPDGSQVVTGNVEGTLLVWSLPHLLATGPRQAGPLAPHALEALWQDLADPDAGRAHQAVAVLAAAPGQALPFLADHLHPASVVAPSHLQKLLHNLDEDDFAVRQAASRELGRLGEQVEAFLAQALKADPSPEAHWRLKRLLAQLHKGQRSPEEQRELRAVTVLERMATPAARKLLERLAAGADGVWMTRLSQAAVQRLGRRVAR